MSETVTAGCGCIVEVEAYTGTDYGMFGTESVATTVEIESVHITTPCTLHGGQLPTIPEWQPGDPIP